MKKLVLFLFLVTLLFNLSNAQECLPQQNLPDTAIGPYPRPYDAETNPTGGITDTACVNEDFEFVVTLAIPTTISIVGNTLPIQSISVNADTAVKNLPKGLDYVCNPPNCVFPANSRGCIKIFGTVQDTVGVYNVSITGNLSTGFFNLPLTFPDATLFRGNYYLHVKPAGQCLTSTDDLENLEVSAFNRPNPFSGWTQIVVNSKVSGNFDFIVSDLVGRQIHRERINLWEGENNLRYDASQLAPGIYIYTLRDGVRQFSSKMIVSK
ncbi:MAG: T9SS type A sorting domain-containing protein [Saprospiraceae bacterium]